MTENEQEKKPEEVRTVEEWINGFVVPIAAAVTAIPGLSPEERAVVLDHALRLLPLPPLPGAAQKAATAPAAEQKPKEAPAPQGMEPLRPEGPETAADITGKALEALPWRDMKNGRGQWVFIVDREGKVAEEFERPPLDAVIEAASAENGVVVGDHRYRVSEGRFLQRWPLKRT